MEAKKKKPKAMEYFTELIANKKKNRHHSTAELYGIALRGFFRSLDKKTLVFRDINRQNLEEYEQQLILTNLSENTIITYLSCLRALYHRAQRDKLIRVQENPFQFRKLKPIPTHNRVISTSVVVEINSLNLKDNPLLDVTRNLFIFCFLTQGMAFIDLAHLTKDNIKGDKLVYYRAKTKRKVEITLTTAMWIIIRKYKNNGPYLFPILKELNTRMEKYKVSLRTYNERLKRVGALLNNPTVITSYSQRHAWAMEANRNGVAISVISQSLGHASEKATLHYIMSLDQSSIARANELVTSEIEKGVLLRG